MAFKEYQGEKKAQFLASKLSGKAFQVYMRLDENDRKNYDSLVTELRKEYKKGTRDREAALVELSGIKYNGHSIMNHAYDIMELIKLAYPTFTDAHRQIVAKDYFLKSIHKDMEIELKAKYPKFDEISLTDLAKETGRLELAGIKSKSIGTSEVNIVKPTDPANREFTDNIVEKVIKRMATLHPTDQTSEHPFDGEQVNYAGKVSSYGNPQRYKGRFNYGKRATTPRGRNRDSKGRCRGCNSTEHFIRSGPDRFCQACGLKGHDSWNPTCAKNL